MAKIPMGQTHIGACSWGKDWKCGERHNISSTSSTQLLQQWEISNIKWAREELMKKFPACVADFTAALKMGFQPERRWKCKRRGKPASLYSAFISNFHSNWFSILLAYTHKICTLMINPSLLRLVFALFVPATAIQLGWQEFEECSNKVGGTGP